MIDRKIKDIDASVELLNDRKEQSKPILILFGTLAVIMFLIAAILEHYDAGIGGYSVAIIVFTGYVGIALLYYNFNILIQFKRIMETQRDHTLLIDEVLTILEKKEKKINTKKKVNK